jgi:glycosyltransferase involved in cell wall biosynthesis
LIAILETHPIQYHVPLWRELAKRANVPFEVWYLTDHGVKPSFDVEFGKVFEWDIDLLEGYPNKFISDSVPERLAGFWKVRLPRSFRELLLTGRVTALFVPGWNFFAFWEAVFLAKKLGIPVWIRGDSNDLKKDALFKWMVKRVLVGAFIRRVDRFLCVGTATKRLYQSYSVDDSRLEWGPHAVDNDFFKMRATQYRSSRYELRRKWGIADESTCVLFVGKFIQKKRPQDLILAVGLLRNLDQKRPYHILFVGAGELGESLRSMSYVVFDEEFDSAIPRAGSTDDPVSSFAGFMNQTQLPQAYAAADMLVLPSESETWGLVINEAMASGLPCIASDACGAAEDLVKPIDDKLVYKKGNIIDLSQSIAYLANYPPDATTLSQQITKYSFGATVESMERMWREISYPKY